VNSHPTSIFLFSVDLEDVRNLLPNGQQYKAKVPELAQQYLNFLKKHDAHCTFFTVGDQLRAYPDLIKKIIDEGHEIACHTDTHKPLTGMTPDNFRMDIENFMQSAKKININNISGFRAPIFSLTQNCIWAYDILKEFGITYSSSVLPAKNPLYGWPRFGTAFKKVGDVLELPITIHPKLNIPLAGGVYFRILPFLLLKPEIKKLLQQGIPLQNYIHPYDIDTTQEHFMHPGINNSKLYNFLMYYNRQSVFKKLEKIMNMQVTIIPYREYVASISV